MDGLDDKKLPKCDESNTLKRGTSRKVEEGDRKAMAVAKELMEMLVEISRKVVNKNNHV